MLQTIPADLADQLARFRARRFLAVPLAGAIAWALVGVGGWVLSPYNAAMLLFIATGCIVYLGLALSRLTGEHAASRQEPRNVFDALFFLAVGSALLVYAIAIPFFLADVSSLPLTVGILTGVMWLPTAWLIGHRIALFHGVVRTLGVVLLWYALPHLRFVAIPFFIVFIYAITIVVLERRWRALQA